MHGLRHGTQRLASAVLLTRGDGPELEIFLVLRHPRLRFFGGYWAFVGGVVDPVDLPTETSDPDSDATHQRCALRELFEETGVLPQPLAGAISPAERTSLRRALLEGRLQGPVARPWRELVDGHPETLQALRPFGRLTTPSFAPVRYRTRFLTCALPDGEWPEVHEGELLQGRFVRPAALLERWRGGGELIVPPVLYLLELSLGRSLAEFPTLAGRACAEHEAGKLQALRSTPGVEMASLRTPTLPPATTTNCYLVGTSALYVVDPATPHADERARLFELLDARLAEGRRLAGVLATHHHADHVGSVQAVAERYGIPVYGHPLTLARLPEPARDGRPLEDGDVLDLGAAPDGTRPWKLTAHHTPGHDRGHLVFCEDRYGSALVGDLVSTVSSIVIDPPEGHLATYLVSLEGMLAVPMGVLHPAHGPTHPDGHALIRRFLAHRREREESLVAALGVDPEGGGLSPGELVEAVYVDLDAGLRPFAERSLLAGLEKLAQEGRAECVSGVWLGVRGCGG